MKTEDPLFLRPLQHNHRIALLVCFFGKFPQYAPLVFHSIGFNDSIDWILIVDQEPQFSLPPNVSYHLFSIKEVQSRIEDACDSPTLINHYYDLTRLKPTYGLTFSDYLNGYDFWGYADLDMIYGDLRKFLPSNILDSHDRIYCRGHLSLFRNNPEVNRFFMLQAPGAPDYRSILSNTDHSQFDEWDGIWKIFRYHRIRQYHAEVIADIRPFTRYKIPRFEALEIENYCHQVFYWHEGKTFQAYYHREGGLFDREVAYIHFQKRRIPTPSFIAASTKGFIIGPFSIVPYDRENLSPSEMQSLNYGRWKPIGEVVSIFFSNLFRKICKLISK